MTDKVSIRQRFALEFEPESYRRMIAKKDVIIHCHHYNSRLQNTIEGAERVPGKQIISSSAEAVFAEQVAAAIRSDDDEATRLAVAAELYAHLGYGSLDMSKYSEGVVTSNASHFVEGWNAAFSSRDKPVCSFTEGYLQGAAHAATGKLVHFHEEECMANGAERCVFRRSDDRSAPLASNAKSPKPFTAQSAAEFNRSTNVDEKKIIDALVQMPIYGNETGLIPAFGVYLANTPADFYNQICIRFVEAMAEQGMFSTAQKLLVYDAETCAMNTFRGIMESAEWDGLVAPMVKEKHDNLWGIVAVSNGLGWGNWHIQEHQPGQSLRLVSLNGYEALGYRDYRGDAAEPQCFMLNGVAAGIMELIYSEGSIEERFGTFTSQEVDCITKGDKACAFEVRQA